MMAGSPARLQIGVALGLGLARTLPASYLRERGQEVRGQDDEEEGKKEREKTRGSERATEREEVRERFQPPDIAHTQKYNVAYQTHDTLLTSWLTSVPSQAAMYLAR